MISLHGKADELFSQVMRIYRQYGSDHIPWDQADLHDLKALGDAAGGDYLLRSREIVDRLNQIREQHRKGSVDRAYLAQTAARLDDLIRAAEHEGL